MPSRHERRQRHQPEPTFSFKRITDAIATHPRISAAVAAGIGVPVLLGGYVLLHDGGGPGIIPPTPGVGRPLSPEPAAPKLEQTRESSRAAFVKRLESFFDFPPTISRAELAGKLFPLSYQDRNWGTNTLLGTLKSDQGQDMSLGLDKDGEAAMRGAKPSKEAAYPTEERPHRFIIEAANNYVVIYGTQDTINMFQNKTTQELTQQFLREYFKDLQSETNVLHLNFFPRSRLFPLEALGREEIRRIIPQNLAPDEVGHSETTRNGITGARVRQDIAFSIPALHGEIREFTYFSADEWLRNVFGNEIATFLPNNYSSSRSALPSPNEAPSTMLGYLTALDDTWAHLMLGGDAYKNFLPLVAQEMERIGKPRS